jgi:hypothetical protein
MQPFAVSFTPHGASISPVLAHPHPTTPPHAAAHSFLCCQSGSPKPWDQHTGHDGGGSVVGDLIYASGVFSVVESLVWQSVLSDACDAAAAAGADHEAAPLVIDGGANIGLRHATALSLS